MTSSTVYCFDDFTLDVGTHQLRRGIETIEISKLSFRLLRALVEAAPNVVTHDELAATIWGPRRIVTPENLAKRVMLLRRALGDRAQNPRYVAGVRGVGYRLLNEVRRPEDTAETTVETRTAAHKRFWPRSTRALRYWTVALTLGVLGFVAIAAALVDESEADGGEASPPAIDVPAETAGTAGANSVRISVEVLDTETERLLWSHTYEGELGADDLLAIKSDLASSIATSLAGDEAADEMPAAGSDDGAATDNEVAAQELADVAVAEPEGSVPM